MTERCCTKCHNSFPATTEFFRKAQGRLRGECKTCSKAYEVTHYQQNKGKRNEANRRWIMENPEARKRHLKTYRTNNADKCKEAGKRWYTNNLQRARALARAKSVKWYMTNLESARALRRASVKRRRAIKRGAGISKLTHGEWEAIKALYKHRCAYCKKKAPLTQDHVVPLSKGGQHTASNVVPACVPCNCSKQAGPPPLPVQFLLVIT
jgi:5-methylcytosine-specific restriction endonuclease McrA